MSGLSVQQMNQRVQREAGFVAPLITEINRIIVGQEALINRLLIALLCDGHVLIEGVPGLAKTLAVRTLAAATHLKFQRIQFTPDLLPADLTGTQIYSPRTGEFTPRFGPVFANIVLADEVNRAPAKVQSALLEAMEERQVTVGDETRRLDEPFLVLATQNPIEQEGTYRLPEAQLDRFMLKVIVGYPSRDQERDILRRMAGEKPAPPAPVIDAAAILQARSVVNTVYVDPRIEEYVLDLVFTTREPPGKLKAYLEYGASPRATLALIRAARAHAFLRGRGFVSPEDVKQIAPDVLRHRLIPTFEAEAENVSVDQLIRQILSQVKVP
jgi:MoxR-like ATPase